MWARWGEENRAVCSLLNLISLSRCKSYIDDDFHALSLPISIVPDQVYQLHDSTIRYHLLPSPKYMFHLATHIHKPYTSEHHQTHQISHSRCAKRSTPASAAPVGTQAAIQMTTAYVSYGLFSASERFAPIHSGSVCLKIRFMTLCLIGRILIVLLAGG